MRFLRKIRNKHRGKKSQISQRKIFNKKRKTSQTFVFSSFKSHKHTHTHKSETSNTHPNTKKNRKKERKKKKTNFQTFHPIRSIGEPF
jgi:hypothetical protein